MAAAPTGVVVESMSIETSASTHLKAPPGGFRSKYDARTRQVADKGGIVFAAQVEKCATKPLVLLYGLSTPKFRHFTGYRHCRRPLDPGCRQYLLADLGMHLEMIYSDHGHSYDIVFIDVHCSCIGAH